MSHIATRSLIAKVCQGLSVSKSLLFETLPDQVFYFKHQELDIYPHKL